MSYDNTNRFSLWPNDRRRDGKQDSHFTGTINVDGVEYWIDGWKRKPEAKQGAPSLSGTIRRKDEQKAANPQAQETPQDDFDDSIPF